MTSCSAFRCAGRGPAVIHPSTDPAKSCLTWVIAWHQTPTTHRTLSVAQYILTDHQDADCRPMIEFTLSRELLVCLYRADVLANIVSPIIGLLVLDRCLSYYRSSNLRFIEARPILSLLLIHRPLIFNIGTLIGPSFILTSPILNG